MLFKDKDLSDLSLMIWMPESSFTSLVASTRMKKEELKDTIISIVDEARDLEHKATSLEEEVERLTNELEECQKDVL